MANKNLIIIGLVAVIIALVVAFAFSNEFVNLPESSKYKSTEEVSGATVDIGSGVENVGSTLEDIDNALK